MRDEPVFDSLETVRKNKSKSEAIAVLVDYLDNCTNQKCIHSSLNYLTPNEYALSTN